MKFGVNRCGNQAHKKQITSNTARESTGNNTRTLNPHSRLTVRPVSPYGVSKLYVKAIKSAIFGIIAFAALIFLPAGTLNYWQGWVFLATFVFSTVIHYRISGTARSKAPRTANKRGTSGGEGTNTKSHRYAFNFPFRGHSGVFRA
jgi:hypothetical protein